MSASESSSVLSLDGGAFDRQSMADRAYSELKRRILFDELAPGTGMLEEELAASLGMSRTPVREAAVRLAQEGLLEIVPRKGIRVTELTKRGVREINEVLACLEVQAAERLASPTWPALTPPSRAWTRPSRSTISTPGPPRTMLFTSC
jgi:DNA-binding GntR family transcriptional regulator